VEKLYRKKASFSGSQSYLTFPCSQSGEVLGKSVVDVKVVACPGRDRDKDVEPKKPPIAVIKTEPEVAPPLTKRAKKTVTFRADHDVIDTAAMTRIASGLWRKPDGTCILEVSGKINMAPRKP